MNSLLVDDRPKKTAALLSTSRTESDDLTIRQVVLGLASMKFTVTLFAMSIVLVFAGTLAQVEKDIWQVIDEYFRTMITWIDIQLFFPASFFPSRPQVPGGFYFPGGWLLGLLMMVNLLAAHGARLRVQARGRRLVIGSFAIAVGVLLTALIVVAGASYDGFRVSAWIGESAAWLDDSWLRILWQLGKGTLAGLVLLLGCVLVFKRRAGVVLIHGGICMMMSGELLVGLTAVEGRMNIREGEAVNYVYDTRTLELAIIDKSKPGRHDVVSIPESMLRGEGVIRHEHLPFDIQVAQFMENARLQYVGQNTPNPQMSGVGAQWVAESTRSVSGTDTSGAINQSAAYLRLLDKRSAADLGTYLVALALSSAELPEKVDVDGQTRHLYLRFKQTYKPYSLTLIDVRKDDYPGTNTPRNYSSDVRLVDASRNVDRETRIWMNNPLRFSGDTFYQSGYFRDPETGFESTTLSVVSNNSWMLPYVACMIVATGMLFHFGFALLRFLKSRSVHQLPRTETVAENTAIRSASSRVGSLLSWGIPAVIVLVMASWIGSKTLPPRESAGAMRLYEFGELPVVYQGRTKPLDTLARNSLRIISNRQTFVDAQGLKQPAIHWLLDLIARPEVEATHGVFRIEHPEVLDAMGLQRRKGLRYSFAELEPRLNELRKQSDLARSMDLDGLSVYQKKILALDNKLALRDLLVQSFVVPQAGKAGDQFAAKQPADLFAVLQQQQTLSRRLPPLCIPPVGDNSQWQAYSTAWSQDQMRPPDAEKSKYPPTAAMAAMFAAYRTGDGATFNHELDGYRSALAANPPADLNLAKTSFESFFNHFGHSTIRR